MFPRLDYQPCTVWQMSLSSSPKGKVGHMRKALLFPPIKILPARIEQATNIIFLTANFEMDGEVQ